jgi:hypothetical protein
MEVGKPMRLTKMFVLLVAMLLLLAACGGAPAVPAPEADTQPEAAAEADAPAADSPASIHEAPMLREMVEAGELPPLEERLPANPMVVPVLDDTSSS